MNYIVLMTVCDWCGEKRIDGGGVGWVAVVPDTKESFDFCSERCRASAQADEEHEFHRAMCSHEADKDDSDVCEHCGTVMSTQDVDETRVQGAAFVTELARRALGKA